MKLNGLVFCAGHWLPTVNCAEDVWWGMCLFVAAPLFSELSTYEAAARLVIERKETNYGLPFRDPAMFPKCWWRKSMWAIHCESKYGMVWDVWVSRIAWCGAILCKYDPIASELAKVSHDFACLCVCVSICVSVYVRACVSVLMLCMRVYVCM